MIDVLKESLVESLKILFFILLIYFIMSFMECKISKKVTLRSKLSPVLGSAIGLIPQCGFSIIASDLYKKRHITVGTLLAVLISCSDEAIPMMLANSKAIITIFPLLVIKFVYGFLVGYLIDFIYTKRNKIIENHLKDCDHIEVVHTGCCNHSIEHENKNSFFSQHIVHPFIHSLKIFIFVLIINLAFGSIVYYIGENRLYDFLDRGAIFKPVFASLVGLIPNCASSVILTELYFKNILSFASLFAGLCCNAGLGIVYLFKHKGIKENMLLIGILWLSSIFAGYLIFIIENVFR